MIIITLLIVIAHMLLTSHCKGEYEDLNSFVNLTSGWRDILGNELPIYDCNGEEIVTTFSKNNVY